jgi:hypothetical protein
MRGGGDLLEIWIVGIHFAYFTSAAVLGMVGK